MLPQNQEINLLSGAFTAPFIDCLLDNAGALESVTTLQAIIMTLHAHRLDRECIHLLQLFCTVMGADFPNAISEHTAEETLSAGFIDEYLKDAEDLLYDLTPCPTANPTHSPA